MFCQEKTSRQHRNIIPQLFLRRLYNRFLYNSATFYFYPVVLQGMFDFLGDQCYNFSPTMKDFKKGNRFGAGGGKGGFNKGGYDRGAPRRDFSARPTEMHQATCARCNKACEVPFRPNGKKPVFCKDCFASNRPDAHIRTNAFSRPNAAPRPPYQSEGIAPRSDDLRSKVEVLNTKLDMLVRMVQALEPTTATTAETLPVVAKIKTSARKSAKKTEKK